MRVPNYIGDPQKNLNVENYPRGEEGGEYFKYRSKKKTTERPKQASLQSTPFPQTLIESTNPNPKPLNLNPKPSTSKEISTFNPLNFRLWNLQGLDTTKPAPHKLKIQNPQQ